MHIHACFDGGVHFHWTCYPHWIQNLTAWTYTHKPSGTWCCVSGQLVLYVSKGRSASYLWGEVKAYDPLKHQELLAHLNILEGLILQQHCCDRTSHLAALQFMKYNLQKSILCKNIDSYGCVSNLAVLAVISCFCYMLQLSLSISMDHRNWDLIDSCVCL
jgi:hypothetical protein